MVEASIVERARPVAFGLKARRPIPAAGPFPFLVLGGGAQDAPFGADARAIKFCGRARPALDQIYAGL
jgi:hypothetical protein